MGSVETGSDGPLDIEKVTSKTGGQYSVKLDSEKPNATTRAEATPARLLDEEATAPPSIEVQEAVPTIERRHASPLHRSMALFALACMWSSAQIPIFLFGMFPAAALVLTVLTGWFVSWRAGLHLCRDRRS